MFSSKQNDIHFLSRRFYVSSECSQISQFDMIISAPFLVLLTNHIMIAVFEELYFFSDVPFTYRGFTLCSWWWAVDSNTLQPVVNLKKSTNSAISGCSVSVRIILLMGPLCVLVGLSGFTYKHGALLGGKVNITCVVKQ